MIQVIPLDYTVAVSGGTGQSDANLQGATVPYSYRINNIGIKAPSSSAVYSITLLDSDGYTIYYESGITGDYSILLSALCRGAVVAKIDGTDGSYSVRIYSEN